MVVRNLRCFHVPPLGGINISERIGELFIIKMPYTWKKVYTKAKKTYKKGYKGTKGNVGFTTSSAATRSSIGTWTSMPSMGTGLMLPQAVNTKLKTSWCGYLGIGSITPTSFSINVASIYRPFNVPSIGVASSQFSNGQNFDQNENPVGYTTLSALYNRYRVVGASVRVRCIAADATDVCTLTLWSNADGVSSNIQGQDLNMNLPFSQTKMVSAGAPPVVLYSYRRLNDIAGMTRINYEGQGSTAFGSQPNIPLYFNIGIGTVDGNTTNSQIYLEVELMQYVQVTGFTIQSQ